MGKGLFIKQQIYTLAIFILLTGNSALLQAQHISGKIVNTNRVPIAFANIMRLHPSDSSFIDGTISSEAGTFFFENIPEGREIVKISCLGYLTRFIAAETNRQQIDWDEIILLEDTTQLSEVVITAAVPLFSRNSSGLTTHVSGTLLSSAGTAIDVIKQIPGVLIKENEMAVFGKGAPVVYINNRKMYDKSELQRIQSSDIATIELLTNPGAKYDAEGKAVLIIHVKQNKENGWAVQVSNRLQKRKYFGDEGSAGISYTQDNFSFFLTCNQSVDKNSWNAKIDYIIYADTVWKQLMELPQLHKMQDTHFTAGIDWSIGSKHALGWQYQGYTGSEQINSDGLYAVWADTESYDKISTKNTAKERPDQNLLNMFYKGNYSETFHLQLNMDYLNNRNKINQFTRELSTVEDRDVNMKSQSDFQLYAGKLIMDYRLGENGNVTFGGEYNQIKGAGFLLNPENYVESSYYRNEEEKAAGFLSYNTQLGKLQVRLGGRYEYARMNATEENRQEKTDRTHQGFYPDVSFYQTVGNTQMGLDFSKKIRRPSFALLNSGNFYANRFLTEKGNPLLQQEGIYQIDYQLKYKIADLKIGYVYIKHPIAFSIESMEDHPTQTLMQYINFPKYRELNALLASNFTCKIWQSRINMALKSPFFKVNYLNEKTKRNQTSFSFDFFNDIVLPKETVFSLNFNYQGKSNNYAIAYNEYKCIEAGIRKYFFSKKLLVNLQFSDLFDWVNTQTTVEINTISYKKRVKYESRSVLLTLSYRFNDYKKKYRGENAAADDINRL
ncbi:MAG: outer membrane beta-barrel protein [Dysgonamonadaceae bacterium]|jgi:hypothetical protein|nr:outer membrane beta-barrel protein [Dysgonamonadaceae bacterium]